MTSREDQAEIVRQAARDPLELVERPPAGPADDLLRHAVLLYGPPDGPDRRATARAILAAHPELPAEDVFVAAALTDPDALRRHLAADSAAANREGGPLAWSPLLYLTYSRVNDASETDHLASLSTLLDAGADPDDGYFWQGFPTPFTALTGLLGGGEQGDVRQPPHPYALPLARRLLEAGADANDGQTLYNRMFTRADGHLELMFRHGLGAGDGGPWHRRLPDLTDSPPDLLRAQLSWAITAGFADRIRLLAAHGVDLASPLDSGQLPTTTPLTPVQLALRAGEPAVAALLVELGAPAEISPVHRLAAALLAADGSAAETICTEFPDAVQVLRQEQPALVVRAAVLGSPAAVRLAAAHGFDVDRRGRADVLRQDEWETALHHAAAAGDLAVVDTLLEMGADPAIKDARFDATPLEWACHFERTATAGALRQAQGTYP